MLIYIYIYIYYNICYVYILFNINKYFIYSFSILCTGVYKEDNI